MHEEPTVPEPPRKGAVPTAVSEPPRRRSYAWLVPVVALLFAGFVGSGDAALFAKRRIGQHVVEAVAAVGDEGIGGGDH